MGNIRARSLDYSLAMIVMRLSAVLLLAALATAQQTSSPKLANLSVPEPKLPVIDRKACPGEGRLVFNLKIQRSEQMFSSFRLKRTASGALKPGRK